MPGGGLGNFSVCLSKRPTAGEISDLRVSVTDRCNFRCHYCLPPRPADRPRRVLPFDEIEAMVGAWSPRRKDVRLTGGEPLVRRDFPPGRDAGRDRGDRGPLADHQRLPARRARGGPGRRRDPPRQRLVDSLQRDRFFQITRRDALPEVCAASTRSPPSPGSSRSRSTPCRCATWAREGALLDRPRPTSRPASSSSCRSTPTAPAPDSVLAGAVAAGDDRRRPPARSAARAGLRRRRGSSASAAARARSASSTRSPNPSAPTATGCA